MVIRTPRRADSGPDAYISIDRRRDDVASMVVSEMTPTTCSCGGTPSIKTLAVKKRRERYTLYQVNCAECHQHGAAFKEEKHAVVFWNNNQGFLKRFKEYLEEKTI